MNGVNSLASKKRTVPVWLLRQEGLTTHQWKAKKRRELKAALRAFDAFRMGCAYTPMKDGEVGAVQDLLTQMTRRLSVKEWGR